MNDLREETRNETIDRIINAVITSQTRSENQTANAEYRGQRITDRETVDWLLTNQGKIIPPHLFDFFIAILADETKRSASRMVAMNTLKQQLLQLQRQRQQEQPQQPQSRVVGGGFHRRTTKFKHQKSRKTKCRRH
jgi:hypothetical protein